MARHLSFAKSMLVNEHMRRSISFVLKSINSCETVQFRSRDEFRRDTEIYSDKDFKFKLGRQQRTRCCCDQALRYLFAHVIV